MIDIGVEEVKKALLNSDTGIRKYTYLMQAIHNVDISENIDFQRKYKDFFSMGRRSEVFYKEYFAYLERNKQNLCLDFETAIRFIYDRVNRIEASFCSKLLHMINPNKPILDSIIREHFKIKAPLAYKAPDKRIAEWLQIYSLINELFNEFLMTEKSKEWINLFDLYYPKAKITDIKKIDFILWQTRK